MWDDFLKTGLVTDSTLREVNKIRAVKELGGACEQCGLVYHFSAMEFHHRRDKIKHKSIGQMLLLDWSKILIELRKCYILCSNCHATIHWQETHPDRGFFGPRDELGKSPEE